MPTSGQEMSLELLADIAIGGTARVELCRAHGEGHAGRLVAVKRLHPQLAREAGVVDALLADVWQASALHHPNVVEVLGLASDTRGPWVAYELVQSVSLARLMKTVAKTGESFHERMAVYIGWCIARGLSAAQRLRMPDGGSVELVHRDLVPESVLVGFAGDVKIADFGWARTKRRVGDSMAGAPVRRGSMLVSPEEVRGLEVGHRADLFSLGALLYELISGRAPWEAEAPLELLRRVVEDNPPDLRRVRPSVDEELSSVVMRCLERDPRGRFQHAGAVLVRLEAWLAAHGYDEDNRGALSRFVRRNAMKQMQWFERALAAQEQPEARRPSLARMRAPSVPPKGAEIESSVTTDERPAHLRRMRDGNEPSDASPASADAEASAAPARAPSSPDEPRPYALLAAAERPQPPAVPAEVGVPQPEPSGAPPSTPGEDTVVEAPLAVASLALGDDEPSESEMTTQALRRARQGQTKPASGFTRASSPSIPPAAGAPSYPPPPAGAPSYSLPPAAVAPSYPPPAAGAPSYPPPAVTSSAPAAAGRSQSSRAPLRRSVPPPAHTALSELTEEALVKEADRLQRAAMRRAEEAQAAALVARAANERAQRTAVIAKKAHEAAVLAREAAKALNKFGHAESARKLERAYAIERSYEAIETRTPSVPPPPPAEPGDPTAAKPR